MEDDKYEGCERKVQLHVRIPIYLKEFLDDYAKTRGMTMSDIVNGYVLTLYMEEKNKEAHGHVNSI